MTGNLIGVYTTIIIGGILIFLFSILMQPITRAWDIYGGVWLGIHFIGWGFLIKEVNER
ncbi:unnamed protein product [marine sediment metagenome]|uniref:Uncharacterized protein n=1 Tax=marine sediment metagenome TaxID=412755 RepID=X1SL66_9ZZZZ